MIIDLAAHREARAAAEGLRHMLAGEEALFWAIRARLTPPPPDGGQGQSDGDIVTRRRGRSRAA